MDVLLTIGEFSKMTYLSVKALRHYHEVGLLEPAAIDRSTGYRQYAASQVATAQAIRRFRELDMPLDEVREVLRAPDLRTRNRTIVAHLERMQEQLDRTQQSVASLQALLTDDPRPIPDVDIRRLPATRVLVATKVVELELCGAWLEPAFAALHELADATGLTVAGPTGALYIDAFFESGVAEVTGFLPVRGESATVLAHHGSFSDLDQAYAALGTVVAERGIGGPGPIREHYLDADTTEVCWPVTTGAIT